MGEPDAPAWTVEADAWTVHYPDTESPAPDRFSTRIRCGEKVLVLGPSGCGKSTLLASLIGLVPHSTYAHVRGDLTLGGHSVRLHGPGELARDVGLVFQDPDSQLTMLTVEEEVAFGLENIGLPATEMPARIERALVDTGLYEQRFSPVDQLSGGMKQRLVIAALVAMEPEVLVLDEPMSQLDPAGTRQISELLQQLVRARPGLTLLVVEHRLDAVLPLLERVLVLDQAGRLALDAPTQTAFTEHAAALADMNVWLPTRAEAMLARARGDLAHWSAPCAPREQADRSPVLQLEDVGFSHRAESPTLDRINLTLFRGEIVALAGGNGSGKSTLAQLCAGILSPQTGSVRLHDLEVGQLPARTLVRQLGYVFQNPEHQFVTDRVLDEVRYNRHHFTDDSDQEAWHVLQILRLDHLADRNPFTLSHGQKRRLSAATALVTRRNVLILDEPTFGQDPSALTELRGLLNDLAASGTAILMITHDMNLIWRSAHRVFGLNKGELLGGEGPAGFFSHPQRLADMGLEPPEIARYAGSESLLTALT